MKKNTIRKTALFAIIVTVNTMCYAQLKIDTLGRVLIGNPPNSNFDLNGVTQMGIFGGYGEYRGGGKLCFGDFGRDTCLGWNVFVGECDDIDSDKLWMHGKKGWRITAGGRGFSDGL